MITKNQMLEGLRQAHDMSIEILEGTECILGWIVDELDNVKHHACPCYDSDKVLRWLTSLDVTLDYLCENFSLDRDPIAIQQPKVEQLELMVS